jgi:hypothetical protein
LIVPKKTVPWKRPAPKRTRHTTLTAAEKREAEARAKRAGRRYPNLVDNMAIAKKKKVGKKTAKRKRTTRTKDPAGGLTAAGREAFHRKQGSHLKPGVKTKGSAMSLDDMRRKGSWATRFYGRKKMPPLLDSHGRPTRFALSAQAWGEPVPKTIEAARRIAERGKRLLDTYRRRTERS